MSTTNERLNKIQAIEACHNCFKDPYANLLLAIYVQAACDTEGYTDANFKHVDGVTAQKFCDEFAELPGKLFAEFGRK